MWLNRPGPKLETTFIELLHSYDLHSKYVKSIPYDRYIYKYHSYIYRHAIFEQILYRYNKRYKKSIDEKSVKEQKKLD